MTDNELDQLMQRVLLDAIKSDCEKENGVAPSFEPSLRYQRSLAAMIADPLKWAHKRTKPLWKKVLQKVAIVLIIFSLSLGSLMVVSPSVRAAVVNGVTEWYETHVTYRYSGISEVEKMPQYEITALPNGYTEVETARVEWPTYVSVVYQNDEEGNSPPIYLRYIFSDFHFLLPYQHTKLFPCENLYPGCRPNHQFVFHIVAQIFLLQYS